MSADRPSAVTVAASVLAALTAHARDAAPDECCGLLVGTAARVDECVRARNVAASPVRFQVDPADHFALRRRLRGTSRSIVGAYHSHPRTPARPSPTDVAEAHYPEFVNLIVSLMDDEPEIRAYRIAGSRVTELEIVIV